MATVLPPRQESRHLGNLIAAFGQNRQRQNLVQGLTPKQQQATQGLPLSQLTNLVMGNAQNQFLSETQKAQQNVQGIMAGRQQRFLQGLGGTNLGNLSPEQAQQGSRLGLFQPPQQPRQLTEFESNIQGFSPEDQTKARRVRARVEPGPTKSGNTKITFDTGFIDDNDRALTKTAFVPTKFEAQAQEIGSKYGTIDPSSIFGGFTSKIEGEEGFNDETKVDQSEFLAVIPDIAQASVIKGSNPVDELEGMFKEWKTSTIVDVDFFGDDDVKLSDISPMPSEEIQAQSIIDSVFPLLDDATREDFESKFDSLDDKGKIEFLRGAFQKGRPRR